MTELQRCSCCKSTMLLETYFVKNRKGVWFKTCNPCRERQRGCKKKHAEEIKERENTPEIKARKRAATQKHRENNPDSGKASSKTYRDEKRDYCEHNTKKRACKVCCPCGYLKMLVSARIREALKTNKSKKSYEYLGCDIATFRTHLESTFKENMTWENHGAWEIDHKIPVAYKQDGVEPSIEEVGLRLHYTNTQALWASENRAKGNKYIG